MTLQKVRVLTVEDTLLYREHADSLVRSWGMESILASDGMEAVELLQRTSVDICLMDIQMPRMNGLEASRRIRSQFGNQFPIIALTALEPSVKPECLRHGMNDYLQKPYADADLKSTLSEWILVYRQLNLSKKKPS